MVTAKRFAAFRYVLPHFFSADPSSTLSVLLENYFYNLSVLLEFLYHPMSLRESAPVHVVRHRQPQTGYYKSPADY